jgi:hypothetical protein
MTPVVPIARAARLGLATAAASRSVLAASFAWLVVLATVHAADAGPPLPALAVTATLLLPIAAWATAAQLAAGSADLPQLLTAAAGGLANLVLDPHPAPLTERLLGALLHLVCGAVGLALALALHAGHVTRGVQALVAVAASLASARLAWLPPARPVLSTWGARGRTPARSWPAGRSASPFW